MPSDHLFASASSSLSGAVLSSSEASVALSSSQFRVTTLSSGQSDPTVSSRRYSVTPSSSQSHVAISSSHPRVTLPSSPADVTVSLNPVVTSQSHGTPRSSELGNLPSSSQSHGTLSLSQFHGTPTALTTLQEGIGNTDRLGVTTYMYSTLEAFQMSSRSFLSDKNILSTNNTNGARWTNTSTLIWYPTLSNFKTHWSAFSQSVSMSSEFMQSTFYASGQSGLGLVGTSSITSGQSASLISRTIFHLHQSVESSHIVYTTNDNSNQDNAGVSVETSATSQSSFGGDLPLSRRKPSSLDISASSTHKTSNLTIPTHEDSLVTDSSVNSVDIKSLLQESMQKTQHTSLHSLAIIHHQTGLAGMASHTTDPTSSTSKASISNSFHNEVSSRKSWNYNLHSSSESDISNTYFSASLDDMFTDTLALSSMSSWNRSIIASVGFIEKTFMINKKFSSLTRPSGNTLVLPNRCIYSCA